ncbi:MAG: ferrous iron transport protein B [Bacteroidia bacterium]|jgi:ferrous iron transport protein B|tara:strand:- start:5410 stop:7269 length:1860 start_codon:yes stop_codon:yes gene_type:complete
MSDNKELKIVLAGNPNCGKSSLFNSLTGLKQKITNVPGTTIENKVGSFSVEGRKIQLIDTPGTYSFNPKSLDEKEAVKVFFDNPLPDAILYVADAANLKRNLFYFSQLAQHNIPMVLVLTMLDIADFKGFEINVDRLEKELGIRVFKVNAREDEGIAEVKKALAQSQFVPHYAFGSKEDHTHESHFVSINKLLNKTTTLKSKRELVSNKIDVWATHPILGYLMFLVVLLIIFQSVFSLASYPMDWIENGFSLLSEWLTAILPDGWLKKLIINGLVAGIAGVVVFVPQIAILFFFMGLLEDTGYMARVSFIMDKMLRGLGLSGKSVVPLLSGAACAIPAIMSTRNIENWKDRLITIMVTPLMSCSARLPVYTLLISMAIPSDRFIGIVSVQALLMLGMYVLGTAAALVAAVVFKWIIRQSVPSYFIMELPVYRAPRWSNIWINMWQKSRSFVAEAGKVILIVSVVLWFLASYGPTANQSFSIQEAPKLDESYAGHFGKAIEPAIKPIGFNWKIGIALITSFAAREVFVGTMSTIYSVGDEENFDQIRDKMRKDTLANGKPVYSIGVVLSLMVFYAFAMQCMGTLAVVYKETKSWKWPAIQFVYMTVLAYIGSWVTFNLFG